MSRSDYIFNYNVDRLDAAMIEAVANERLAQQLECLDRNSSINEQQYRRARRRLGGLAAGTVAAITIALTLPMADAQEKNTDTQSAVETPTTDEISSFEAHYREDKVSIAWLPNTVKFWSAEIEEAAARYNIEQPNFMAILMTLETSGHERAVSKAGAQGLMQLMPKTQSSLMAKYNLPIADMFNGRDNLNYSAQLLKELFDKYQSLAKDEITLLKAVAADYNGGPSQGFRVVAGQELNLTETRHYVMFVEGMWNQKADPTSPMLEHWKEEYHGNLQIKKAEQNLYIKTYS